MRQGFPAQATRPRRLVLLGPLSDASVSRTDQAGREAVTTKTEQEDLAAAAAAARQARNVLAGWLAELSDAALNAERAFRAGNISVTIERLGHCEQLCTEVLDLALAFER